MDWKEELRKIQHEWNLHRTMNTCSVCDSQKGHTSMEDFIENLLEQERKRMSEEIRNTDTSELYDGDGETHNGWEQAKNYFLSIINK